MLKKTKHFDYADLPYFSNIGRKLSSGKNVDDQFTVRLSNSIVGFFNDFLIVGRMHDSDNLTSKGFAR